MLIAARNSFMVDGELSAKSYIQDGLVSMWDGIENAGWGVHDPNATVWTDLVGNRSFDLNEKALWTHNGITRVEGSTFKIGALNGAASSPPTKFASELVFLDNSTAGRACCLGFDKTSGYYGWATTGVREWRAYQLYGSNPYVKLSAGEQCRLSYGFASEGNTNNYLYKNRSPITTKRNNNTSYGAGTLFGGVSDNTNYDFNGIVYCCRLYDRLLTADEIAHNYAVDKARFGLP